MNSDISRVLSYMGHTDCIAVGACGLPIADEVERIDLALKFGVPIFMDTLKVVVEDMKVEKPVLEEEIKLTIRKSSKKLRSFLRSRIFKSSLLHMLS